MDTEIEVRKMECKEIRVDVRTASIKESTEMSVQLEEQSRIVELTEKIYFYQQKYGLVNMKMRIL